VAKKRPDEKIAAPKPSESRKNPHKAVLKSLLEKKSLTFNGADRGHSVGENKGAVLAVATDYWQTHQNLPMAAVITWAHAAFWEIEKERSKK